MAEQPDLFRPADVQDQGIVLGTALGFEDFCYGGFVQPVGAETVDRLCGDGNQLALPDQLGGTRRGFRILGG